jgi:hypothetical protein
MLFCFKVVARFSSGGELLTSYNIYVHKLLTYICDIFMRSTSVSFSAQTSRLFVGIILTSERHRILTTEIGRHWSHTVTY